MWIQKLPLKGIQKWSKSQYQSQVTNGSLRSTRTNKQKDNHECLLHESIRQRVTSKINSCAMRGVTIIINSMCYKNKMKSLQGSNQDFANKWSTKFN